MTLLRCLRCNVKLKIKFLERSGPRYPLILICLECSEAMIQDAGDQPLRVPTEEEFAHILETAPIQLVPLLMSARSSRPRPS